MTTRRTAEQLWALYNSSPNFTAWEHVIRHGESYHDDRAWTVRWGGTGHLPKTFNSLAAHPRLLEPGPKGPSSAAGAFQITMTTWDSLAYLNLPDFSAKSQRIAMMALTERHGALDDVLAGRLDEAMRKCKTEWSSLPFGTDGQPTVALADAHQVFTNYGGKTASDTQPAAPIEERSVQMEQQPAAPTTSFDWATITKVGGALAGFFNPFVGALITGFGPLLQQKIAAEIGRHTDPETAKNVAANLSDVITKAATRETGKTNEIEVLQAVAQSPAVLTKIEDAVVSRLEQLQPFLDRLHEQSKDEWAAEEESRRLAAERIAASPDGPKIQMSVLRYTLFLLAGVLVYVGALIGFQMWLSDGEEPNGQLLILFVMLATMIANVYRTVADWSYGSSKNSAAKDVTISEITRG